MTIITAAEVQEGDLIKVTRTEQDGDRKTVRIFEGVAHTYEEYLDAWRTAESWNLFTGYDGAVIELLDRPKPKVKVPTAKGAVVKYVGHNSLGKRLNRTAIRDERGVWKSYDDSGHCTLTSDSDEVFADRMGNKEDFTVLFAGVGK